MVSTATPVLPLALPTQALAEVESVVRDQVRTQRIDPVLDRAALREIVVAAVQEDDDRALSEGLEPLPARAPAVAAVMVWKVNVYFITLIKMWPSWST